MKPYRPSTGTEGVDFEDWWCGHCVHDQAFRDDPDFGQGCQIIADALAFDIADPRYPKEWVWKDGEPCCTAFSQDPACLNKRCTETLDLFGEVA